MKKFVHLSFSYLKYTKNKQQHFLWRIFQQLFYRKGSLLKAEKGGCGTRKAEYGTGIQYRGDLAWIKDFEKEDQGRV